MIRVFQTAINFFRSQPPFVSFSAQVQPCNCVPPQFPLKLYFECSYFQSQFKQCLLCVEKELKYFLPKVASFQNTEVLCILLFLLFSAAIVLPFMEIKPHDSPVLSARTEVLFMDASNNRERLSFATRVMSQPSGYLLSS